MLKGFRMFLGLSGGYEAFSCLALFQSGRAGGFVSVDVYLRF